MRQSNKHKSVRARLVAPLAKAAACVAAAGALLLACGQAANAQTAWPAKPLRIVVPFPPGGSADATVRVVGQALAERLNQPVVIDNKPGGNMIIGATEVAHAAADGYTLLFTLDTVFTVNPFAYSKLSYDPVNDFTPVSLVTTQSMWFVTNPKKNISSMKDLVGVAKASPGKLNYGSGAIVGQLTGELLKSLSGAKMTYIPYRGSGPAAQALLAGEIDVAVSDITPLIQHIKEGKLVALGQTGTARADFLPQVPTMIEQGMNDFEVIGWFAIYAPAKTPPAIVARLNGELARILANPEIKTRIANFGLTATASTPDELRARTTKDAERWARVIRAENIKLD